VTLKPGIVLATLAVAVTGCGSGDLESAEFVSPETQQTARSGGSKRGHEHHRGDRLQLLKASIATDG
jgi:hypothetical protein